MKKIKKILLVGAFSSDPAVYTYATSFYKAFKKLGYEVEKFNPRKLFTSKRFIRFKKTNDFLCNVFLYRKVVQFQPDLIFFIKSENIFPATLRRIKSRFDTFIANFYPDNPFVFWNGNSNSNILLSLPVFDCFLIWSRMLMPVLESAGCKNVYYFPFAYDSDLFKLFDEFIKKDCFCDVCFAGTWDKEREIYLTKLCEKMTNLDLGIWGNMWSENLPKNSVLRNKLKGKAIYPPELINIFKNSKIVLNFIRKQNMTSHNMRTFEVPASGAFLLSERTQEQAEFLFIEGESIECFDGIDELAEKIEFYLDNEFKRLEIINKSKQVVIDFTLEKALENFLKRI